MTAREAKQNLEPFGYKGPAKWASIDAFVEANPRAKAAVTANKGMFVQSEALGFAPAPAPAPAPVEEPEVNDDEPNFSSD